MTVLRSGRTVVAAATVAVLAVPSAAYAHSTIFHVRAEPLAGNGFQRAQRAEPQTLPACGTQVTLTPVKDTVHERITEPGGGLTVVEVKGELLFRVTAKDGRRIPQLLNASGPGTIFVQESQDKAEPGATIVQEFRGASVLLPEDEVTNTMHRQARLPFFTIINGTMLMKDTYTGPRETAKHTSAQVLRRPATVVDGCTLLRRR